MYHYIHLFLYRNKTQKEHITCTLSKQLFIGLYKNINYNLSLQIAKDLIFI